MKLPGWQASTSTAMPKIGAPQLGAPKMVAPKVMNFHALDNPNDYLRLGAAKSRKNQAVFDLGVTAASVYMSVKAADETAYINLRTAEYAEEQARRQAALDASPFSTVDPATGKEVFGWQDAVAQYDIDAAELQQEIGAERELTPKGRMMMEKGFSTVDKTFRSKTQTFVVDRTVDLARANTVKELDIAARTGNFERIKDIVRETKGSGVLGRKEAIELGIKYTEEAWAHVGTSMINTLRTNAMSSNMGKASFDASYYNITAMLQSQEFGGDAKSRQLLFKQAVDLKNRYEDTIMGMHQSLNYARDKVEIAEAGASGDPIVLQNTLDAMLSGPDAVERYGEAGYLRLTELGAGYAKEGGVTSIEAGDSLAQLKRDTADGIVPEAEALNRINAWNDIGELSSAEYRAAVIWSGEVQNAVVKESLAQAKRLVWGYKVQAQEHEFLAMSFEVQNKKASDKAAAYRLTREVNRAIKEGFATGKPIDVDMYVASAVAKDTVILGYMRNAGGNQASDIWDIDETASLEYSERMKADDIAAGMNRTAVPDYSDRYNKIKSNIELQRTVPKNER